MDSLRNAASKVAARRGGDRVGGRGRAEFVHNSDPKRQVTLVEEGRSREVWSGGEGSQQVSQFVFEVERAISCV